MYAETLRRKREDTTANAVRAVARRQSAAMPPHSALSSSMLLLLLVLLAASAPCAHARSGGEILEAILASRDPFKAGAYLRLKPEEISSLADALIARLDKSEISRRREREREGGESFGFIAGCSVWHTHRSNCLTDPPPPNKTPGTRVFRPPPPQTSTASPPAPRGRAGTRRWGPLWRTTTSPTSWSRPCERESLMILCVCVVCVVCA